MTLATLADVPDILALVNGQYTDANAPHFFAGTTMRAWTLATRPPGSYYIQRDINGVLRAVVNFQNSPSPRTGLTGVHICHAYVDRLNLGPLAALKMLRKGVLELAQAASAAGGIVGWGYVHDTRLARNIFDGVAQFYDLSFVPVDINAAPIPNDPLTVRLYVEAGVETIPLLQATS